MLQGKVAWITGAGSGIGRSGALELSAAGARVVLSGRRSEQLKEVAAKIEAAGGKADTAPLDVADKAAVAKVAAGILDRH
ncbi:MAG TPA: SDR family NAD(P)-dependent oxidoreductase, partial [Stellaceae bacterium]|nr:SDR family NAD(P)-dependent oxidoreductase [Stellaceae bacterium]